MAMKPNDLKEKFKQTIINGLKAQFGGSIPQGGDAQENWAKMAEAISGIAADIVAEITSNAEVVPGVTVSTVGSPMAQTGPTTAPGKIM